MISETTGPSEMKIKKTKYPKMMRTETIPANKIEILFNVIIYLD